MCRKLLVLVFKESPRVCARGDVLNSRVFRAMKAHGGVQICHDDLDQARIWNRPITRVSGQTGASDNICFSRYRVRRGS